MQTRPEKGGIADEKLPIRTVIEQLWIAVMEYGSRPVGRPVHPEHLARYCFNILGMPDAASSRVCGSTELIMAFRVRRDEKSRRQHP